MRACAIVLVGAGCSSVGSLEIDLALPTTAELQPAPSSSITLLGSPRDGMPTETNAVVTGTSIAAGDLGPANAVQFDVRLNDATARLVGFGRAPERVDIALDRDTHVTIPVRRPFVFAADGAQLLSFDASLDPSDASFQGRVASVAAPKRLVAVGEQLVVTSDSAVQVVDTATNQVTGAAITIAGTINDVATIPGQRAIAVAHANGMSFVDLDTGIVRDVAVPSIDRVAVGTIAGQLTAYGLIGRVAPPFNAYDDCSGASSLVAVDVATATASPPIAMSDGIAAITVVPDRAVYAALPCRGSIARFDGAVLADVSPLERAAVVVAADDRIWAVGVHAAEASCITSGGSATQCTSSAVPLCGVASSPQYSYVTAGGSLIVHTFSLDGALLAGIGLPPQTATMISTDDPAHSHAQILNPLGVEPIDVVALPDGQSVALAVNNTYFITELVDTLSATVVLPCLSAGTTDWMVINLGTAATTARVRTRCRLAIGPTPPGTIFPSWACQQLPGPETPVFGEFDPTAVGAIYGAR